MPLWQQSDGAGALHPDAHAGSQDRGVARFERDDRKGLPVHHIRDDRREGEKRVDPGGQNRRGRRAGPHRLEEHRGRRRRALAEGHAEDAASFFGFRLARFQAAAQLVYTNLLSDDLRNRLQLPSLDLD